MRKCPKCHSSMLMDFGDAQEGWQRMWKCLGCGREVLADPVRRVEDEKLKQRIWSAEGASPAP